MYNKTALTAISWFKDDSYFDTIDGIYNAIVYKDTTLLKYYKTRYKNNKLFITTDYSTYYEFDSNGFACIFKEEEFYNGKLLLDLLDKLKNLLESVNDGSFEVEDRISKLFD